MMQPLDAGIIKSFKVHVKYVDHENIKFWKDLKPEVTRDSAVETAYAYKEKVNISRIIALRIEQRAKELELATSRKQPSDQSKNGSVSSTTSSGEYRHRRQCSRISKATRETHVNRDIKLTDYDAKWIINAKCVSTELMILRDRVLACSVEGNRSLTSMSLRLRTFFYFVAT